MDKHKGHHGGRYDDPHGVTSKMSDTDRRRYKALRAVYPNLTHNSILGAMDRLYKQERYQDAERIMGGDYEFEMDNERRMEREAPFAEGGYEDAAHQDRLGMME